MKKLATLFLSISLLASGGCKSTSNASPSSSPSGTPQQAEGINPEAQALYDSVEKKVLEGDSVAPESNGYSLLAGVLSKESHDGDKAPFQALNRYADIYSEQGPEAASKALESGGKDLESFLTIQPTLVEVIKRPNFNWPSEWDKGASAPIPNLILLRDAARGLTMMGLNYERTGDYQKASESYMDCLRLGSKLSGKHQLISQMVSVAILNHGEQFMGDLLAEGTLTAEQYRQIIKELEALPLQKEDFRDATDGEFALIVKTLNMLEKGEINEEDLGAMGFGEVVMVKLMIPGERKAYTDLYLAQRPDFETLQTTFYPEKELEKYKTLVLTPIMYQNFTKAMNFWRRALTGISALKAQAALGAYQAEKKAYPDSLSALVPDYLPELPVDYFSQDGQFQYTKTEKSFTLASASPDLKTLDIEGDLVHYPRPPRPEPEKAAEAENAEPTATATPES